LLDFVRYNGAVVPALWFLELSNILLQAERRQRIAAADVAVRLEWISALPILVDLESIARAWTSVLELARAEKLPSYDAAYLEIAVRRGIALFTKDRALASAGRRAGLEILPT
jgi:predicted nucleic acid-binding protein